ncbi:Predicted metalloprotease, contains C-terminal PDZ domain [Spirosomataceae bacterium TFI 002]|nr:Predicted metalloprotease, contains C-terminal PDZ domain [Spirosomataceae bacterium TFI 002]
MGQHTLPRFEYTISINSPQSKSYEVEMQVKNWKADNILLKLPNWMPGYYQLMNYSDDLNGLSCEDKNGKQLTFEQKTKRSWLVTRLPSDDFKIKYTIKTHKSFVANSIVDSLHAYIIPANSFLYVDGYLDSPVLVNLNFVDSWNDVATGLETVSEVEHKYLASDFDILYDCPILIGNLDHLPSFDVDGKVHEFVGFKLGDFNKELFVKNLQKMVTAASNIIGDIPYKKYTFIGIGPGRGGIEHLNNTTISFDGNDLKTPKDMNRVMNFLAHEYFHHYNVKRIRPFELGPFDYENGNKTNLLWICEGLTVYYEYLIVKRAGLVDLPTLLSFFESNINAHENNTGKNHQSLQQASYHTWSDGPFGGQKGKSISYYDKGPIVGLFLDLEIRNGTKNKKSLDDVMRMLYQKYYLREKRGFTEAEFQAICEEVSQTDLSIFFEYVYTTKELDYPKYLAHAGLKIDSTKEENGKLRYSIAQIDKPNSLQKRVLASLIRE